MIRGALDHDLDARPTPDDEDTLTMDDAMADVLAACRDEDQFLRFALRVRLGGMSPEAAARACRRELEEDGNG